MYAARLHLTTRAGLVFLCGRHLLVLIAISISRVLHLLIRRPGFFHVCRASTPYFPGRLGLFVWAASPSVNCYWHLPGSSSFNPRVYTLLPGQAWALCVCGTLLKIRTIQFFDLALKTTTGPSVNCHWHLDMAS